MTESTRDIPLRMLLQRVAVARRKGNWRLAEAEWNACIARARPRVEIVVDDFVRRRLVASADRDDLVQKTLERAGRRMAETLEVLEEQVFFAAMATCAVRTCQDEGRKHKRKLRREVSLDAPGSSSDGDDIDRSDFLLGGIAEDVWERGAAIREAHDRVDAAVARLKNERAKKLLTLQRLGTPDSSIAEQLGVSMDNLYQIRSRALKDLRGLIDP